METLLVRNRDDSIEDVWNRVISIRGILQIDQFIKLDSIEKACLVGKEYVQRFRIEMSFPYGSQFMTS